MTTEPTPGTLTLERRDEANRTAAVGPVLLTPLLDEDYWAYRVRLTDQQAVVGFPKFTTIGIGFAVENEDGNTNLPYSCDAEQIARHILVNKGDDAITFEDVVAAVELIRQAAIEDRDDALPAVTA